MATPAAASATSGTNPGNQMASAVDAEMAKYRQIQTDLRRLHQDMQIVKGQETENEMVLQELELHSTAPSSASDGTIGPVYKMIGPVLIEQDLDEAKQTVSKRLEFIRGEIAKFQNQISSKETRAEELSQKVQQMQAQLQQATAHAIRAIQEQHAAGGTTRTATAAAAAK